MVVDHPLRRHRLIISHGGEEDNNGTTVAGAIGLIENHDHYGGPQGHAYQVTFPLDHKADDWDEEECGEHVCVTLDQGDSIDDPEEYTVLPYVINYDDNPTGKGGYWRTTGEVRAPRAGEHFLHLCPTCIRGAVHEAEEDYDWPHIIMEQVQCDGCKPEGTAVHYGTCPLGDEAQAANEEGYEHHLALERIARRHLRIETLATRNSDSLDFHDCSVAELKDALQAAYELGQQSVTNQL